MNDQVEVRSRHTGASILRIYIPDYKRDPLTVDEEAEQIAQNLVSKFGKALRAEPQEGGSAKDTRVSCRSD